MIEVYRLDEDGTVSLPLAEVYVTMPVMEQLGLDDADTCLAVIRIKEEKPNAER